MSNKKIDALATVEKGRYDWKIKVKVIRNWRGATNSGEQFKSFNVLLIDQQVTKSQQIHPHKLMKLFNINFTLHRKRKYMHSSQQNVLINMT